MASRPRIARAVAGMPSAWALRTAWRTRSGRARAFASRLDLASAVTAASVPGEITEATVRTSTSAGLITGRGTSSTSTGPPLTGCTTCFMSRPSWPARVQIVAAPAGRTASIRQVSTGAPAVLPNPAATEPRPAASRTGPVAATATWKAPAGPVTRAVRSSTRTSEPGGRCQRMAIWCRPRPAYRVLDPQAVFSQQPAAAVPGTAGQVPEPVVDRLAADAGRVGAGGQPADPGPPPGPERGPHLGGVRPVQLDRAVRGGGPLVTAHRAGFVAGRAGIDQQRHPVHVQQAAERVGVRVGRQGRRARRPDVGEQVPAADRGPHQAGRGQHVQRAAGRRAGPQHGQELPVDRVAVVEQRHLPVRGEHRAQPAPHPVDGRG